MRWRVIALGALTVVLTAITALCIWQSSTLFVDGQNIFSRVGGTDQPSQQVMDAANRLFQVASALQQLVTPLALGAIVCGLAVLLILARRWQLRDARPTRAERPA